VILKRGGALTSESFPLWERVVLGRFDPDTGPVDVDFGALPEAVYVSRRHAEMWRDTAGQWFIKDLGAGNGTFVRTQSQTQFQRVTGEQPIADGDEIALGNARFAFRVG
jgi:pSer/pThr/pTyr-binding forkhead associated (FHA) protein